DLFRAIIYMCAVGGGLEEVVEGVLLARDRGGVFADMNGVTRWDGNAGGAICPRGNQRDFTLTGAGFKDWFIDTRGEQQCGGCGYA
ncbi:MAG: hypothetical protein RR410_08215, partial [Alistipes sp.]